MKNEMTFTPIAPSELISAIVEEVKKELKQFIEKTEKEPKKREKEYLTVKEACKYLKCSSVKLWRLRKDGKLPFKKSGRTVLLKKTDLELYLDNITKEGGQDD